VIGMLVAYDASGVIVATLSHMVQTDEEGEVVGMVDFFAAEAGGTRLIEVWRISNAVGSGTWPEWLGSQAHMFKVIRDPSHPHPIRELEHVGRRETIDERGQRISAIPASGHRRIRSDVESAVDARLKQALRDGAAKVDIRDIAGLPDQPLQLRDDGTTKPKRARVIPRLPLIGEADTSPTSPEAPSGLDTPSQEHTASLG
jgi:hypothetical protein